MNILEEFFNQANLSTEGIPQVAAVTDSCTVGANVPAMLDEPIIVKQQGIIFLGQPFDEFKAMYGYAFNISINYIL